MFDIKTEEHVKDIKVTAPNLAVWKTALKIPDSVQMGANCHEINKSNVNAFEGLAPFDFSQYTYEIGVVTDTPGVSVSDEEVGQD